MVCIFSRLFPDSPVKIIGRIINKIVDRVDRLQMFEQGEDHIIDRCVSDDF
jgi:hypothetical protein